MKKKQELPPALMPQSVDTDGSPTLAQMFDTARVRDIKNTETIRVLRAALREQRNKHTDERRKLKREIRESQLLLMIGAGELRLLREGYLQIARAAEEIVKGKTNA